MSEIERLAKATAEALHSGACWKYLNRRERKESRTAVRAILQAMREPSEGMLIAGQKAQWASIQSVHIEGQSVDLLAKAAAVDPDHTRAEWQAMLDHLLAEPEGGA